MVIRQFGIYQWTRENRENVIKSVAVNVHYRIQLIVSFVPCQSMEDSSLYLCILIVGLRLSCVCVCIHEDVSTVVCRKVRVGLEIMQMCG